MHIAKKNLQRSSPLRGARAGTHHRIKHHQVSLRFWNSGGSLTECWGSQAHLSSIWRFFGVNNPKFGILDNEIISRSSSKLMCTGSLLIHITYIVHHLKKLFSWFMYDSHLLSTRWMILGLNTGLDTIILQEHQGMLPTTGWITSTDACTKNDWIQWRSLTPSTLAGSLAVRVVRGP